MSSVVCQVVTAALCSAVIATVVLQVRVRVPWTRVSVQLCFVTPLLAAAILCATTCVPLSVVWLGFVGRAGSIQPYTILLLLYGLAYGCISIDESGVLTWVAAHVVKRARTKRRLFVAIFALTSVLTVFTSNDVVILVMTPVVCAVGVSMKMEPTPFLLTQFVAANVLSTVLLIGNPTNVIVGSKFHLSFAAYTAWCGLPALVAGCVACASLFVYYRSSLNAEDAPPPIALDDLSASSSSDERSSDGSTEAAAVDAPQQQQSLLHGDAVMVQWASAIVGSTLLLVTLALMFGLSFVGVDVWIIGLAFGGCCALKDVVFDLRARAYRLPSAVACLKRLPPELAFFMVGMFILVESLNHVGITARFGTALATVVQACNGNVIAVVLIVGVSASLACCALNNQPMAILFANIVASANLPPALNRAAMLSVALGSNFGANLSLVASLAGIMFVSILKPHGVSVSAGTFSRMGFATMPLTIGSAMLTLGVESVIVAQ